MKTNKDIMADENKTTLMIRDMNASLKRKFKAKVAGEGTNMTAKITGWIQNYVNNKNGKQVNN